MKAVELTGHFFFFFFARVNTRPLSGSVVFPSENMIVSLLDIGRSSVFNGSAAERVTMRCHTVFNNFRNIKQYFPEHKHTQTRKKMEINEINFTLSHLH